MLYYICNLTHVTFELVTESPMKKENKAKETRCRQKQDLQEPML